jgi:serine/threonine protein phosphatase PrpC
VGDCRAYRLARGTTPGTGGARAARIDLLTRDDTFRHLGERVPPGSLPDDPARMIGNGATLGANVAVHDLGPGEVLALCSDGVHRRLGAGDWRRVLAQRVSLAERCEDAIRVARAHGSEDDATVLLIERPASRPAGAGGPEPGALRRVGRALQAAFVRRRGDGGAS